MPRLTIQLYLARHHDLKTAWIKAPQLFEVLAPRAYWDLHEYYQPTKDLTDQQLLGHRRWISRRDPSLPQRAGKAYLFLVRSYLIAKRRSRGDLAKFNQALRKNSRARTVTPDTQNRAGTIEVTAQFRVEIDYEKLAKALLRVIEGEGPPT